MSPACSDPKAGQLLHAYELGRLSEADSALFEMHLLECEQCSAEVTAFAEVAEQLREGDDVREWAAAHPVEGARASPPFSRLLKSLWPQGNLLLKPAVAYAALVLLLYPAYLGLKRSPQEPAVATTIVLTGTRGTASVPAVSGNPVVLYFRVPGHEPEGTYHVLLASETGATVYERGGFSAVDDREMATLMFPPGGLGAGRYRLVISTPGGELVEEYRFQLR